MPEPTPPTPPAPRPRADAARNREAVLTAADRLFAECESPGAITMADIAAAAGVGKATLFRGFGDRTGLIRALHETRLAPIRQAAEEGPPPLGPTAPPHERVPALLDALLCFKLDNRHLSLALEGTGNGSPYAAGHYAHWHTTLRTALAQIPDLPTPDFTAHALLAATRADLVEHLAGTEGLPREQLRSQLAEFTARVLGPAAGEN